MQSRHLLVSEFFASLELAEGGRAFFCFLVLRGSVEQPEGCLEEELRALDVAEVCVGVALLHEFKVSQ